MTLKAESASEKPRFDRYSAYPFYQRFLLSPRGVIPHVALVSCSAIGVSYFFRFSESNYLGKTYFPVFSCRNLCSYLFTL